MVNHLTIKPREHLPNYIRMHRRRSGMTQHELGRIVGYSHQGPTARHESFESAPSLRVAFAYAALFGISVEDMFRGTYESVVAQVEEGVASFEAALGAMKATGPGASMVARKLEWLCERKVQSRRME